MRSKIERWRVHCAFCNATADYTGLEYEVQPGWMWVPSWHPLDTVGIDICPECIAHNPKAQAIINEQES